MPNIVRVGIVGCGEVTQIIHLPTLQRLRERFRVTAICDVSAAVLKGVGDEWSIAARFTDYRELIVSNAIDAVLVANPHVFHAEVAMAAMQAGRHVLIEKPMCISVAEADAMIAKERESGVIAQVGFMRRYAPAFIKAVELVRGMEEIRLARVRDIIGKNALIIAQISNVFRPTDLPKEAADELRSKQSAMVTAAVGQLSPKLETTYVMLLGLGSHDISAMREMLGLPRAVLHAASSGKDGRTVTAAFDYGNFVCQFEMHVDLLPRFDAHIEIHSPSRVVSVDYNTPYVRNIAARLTVADVDPGGSVKTTTEVGWEDAFVVEWLAFYDNVTRAQKPKTSLTDAREDFVIFRDMIDIMRRAET